MQFEQASMTRRRGAVKLFSNNPQKASHSHNLEKSILNYQLLTLTNSFSETRHTPIYHIFSFNSNKVEFV